MGLGKTGVLCYIDENGDTVQVSAVNPLPQGVRLFVSAVAADQSNEDE